MDSRVVLECHLWLMLTVIKDADKGPLLGLPGLTYWTFRTGIFDSAAR